MKNTILLGIIALTFAAVAGGILPAFAASADPQPGQPGQPPQPGRVYYVVYNQTDGSIAAAGDCPASFPPITFFPVLQPGQSVLWITVHIKVDKEFISD